MEYIEEIEKLRKRLIHHYEEATPEILEKVDYEWIGKYSSVYDMYDSYYGLDLLNSEHDDIEWLINNFMESGCKSWNEFVIHLYKENIAMYEKYYTELTKEEYGENKDN
jgi:hypothetical protein